MSINFDQTTLIKQSHIRMTASLKSISVTIITYFFSKPLLMHKLMK